MVLGLRSRIIDLKEAVERLDEEYETVQFDPCAPRAFVNEIGELLICDPTNVAASLNLIGEELQSPGTHGYVQTTSRFSGQSDHPARSVGGRWLDPNQTCGFESCECLS
jgi:hypothetical protein